MNHCKCGKFTKARQVWTGFGRILNVEPEPSRFEVAKALMTKRLRREVEQRMDPETEFMMGL